MIFRKRTSITVLDIEGGELLVVQATAARVTRAASAAVEWPSSKTDAVANGAVLRKALESLQVKAKEVVFAIPRGQVVLRPLQVPMAADLRELAAIINIQIAKDLPFRVEDAVIDFKVLRAVDLPAPETEAGVSEPQRRLEVLVGAVKADLVGYYRELAKAAGVKLAGIALRSSGLAHGLAASGTNAPDSAILAVALRPEEITIDVIAQGKLAFSRVAAVPALLDANASEPDKDKFLQQLAVEVVRSLHSYEGSAGFVPATQLVILGSTGLEPATSAALRSRLALEPRLVVPEQPKDTRGAPSAAALLTASGVALASLQPAGLPLDFANPKKPALRNNSKRVRMFVSAAAVILVLFTLFGVRAHLVKKRQAIKTAAQLELTEAEKKLPIYRRLKAQTKVVSSWLADDQNWLDHLAYLSAILPPADQLYVSALNTTPQHIIRISVQAKTGELLAELDKTLRAAGYEVKPLSITPAADKHGYSFRTTVELAVPKKMKPDITKQKPPPRPPDDASGKSAAAARAGQGGAS